MALYFVLFKSLIVCRNTHTPCYRLITAAFWSSEWFPKLRLCGSVGTILIEFTN